MVLEPGDHARAAAEVGLDRAVPDQARPRLAHRAQVHEADAGQLLAAELVGVAEQLVAAADRQHDRAAAGRRVQRLALGRRHVVRHGDLVAVLAAAHVEEVVGVRVERLAAGWPRRARTRARATRSARAGRRCCRGRRRCSSARDRASRPSASAYDHHAADVGGGLGHRRAARPAQPVRRRLALELVRASASRAAGCGAAPSGRRPGTRSGAATRPRRRRAPAARPAAGSSRSSRRAVPTSGTGGGASSAATASSRSAIAAAKVPPGPRQPRNPGEQLGARRTAPPMICRNCIGAITSAKLPIAPRLRASASRQATCRPRASARAGRARRAGQRVRVQRRHLVARLRQVERDAAGAGAEVEHRPAGRGGQLAPQPAGPRRSRRSRRRARSPRRSLRPPPRQAAPREQVAQLEQGRVGRQRVEALARRRSPPPRRASAPGRGRRPARRRSRRTSGRSAISSARVPEQVARRTRPASTSKSASQIQETSRPSAMRSFSASQRSSPPSSSVSVRSTSFAPAGFLTSRIDTWRPAIGIVSTRPNAPAEPLQRLAHGGQRHAQLERRRRGGDGVVDVVEAGEGEGAPSAAPCGVRSSTREPVIPSSSHARGGDLAGSGARGRSCGQR